MEEERIEKGEATKSEGFECPVGQFFDCLRKGIGPKSEFRRHLSRSKIEFLKAIRSLIDERIEELERKANSPQKKAIKVAVE